MLTKQKLAAMNSRSSSHPEGRKVALYAALGAVVAAMAVGILVSYALGAAVLLLGITVAFLLGRRGSGAPRVELFYNLDAEAGARFSEVQKACEALAGSEKVWGIDGEGGAADGSVVPVGSRHPVSVGLPDTPDFSANVRIWGIEGGGTRLYFLPECVLSYREGRYQPISYDSFGVVYSQSRRTEDEEVPSDAEVLGETGSSLGTNGIRRVGRGPDHPVVAYGMLAITGVAEGETMRLLASNKVRAVRAAVRRG